MRCSNNFKNIFKIVIPHKKLIGFLFVFVIFHILVGISLIYNSVNSKSNFVYLFVFALIFSTLITFLEEILIHKISYKTRKHLINQAFNKILNFETTGYPISELNAVIEYNRWLADSIPSFLRSIFRRFLTITFLGIYLLFFNTYLSLIGLLLFPLLFLPGWILGKRSVDLRRKAFEAEGIVYENENETIKHLNVVKSYGKTNFFKDLHSKYLEKSENLNLKYKMLYSLVYPLSQISIFFSASIIYLSGKWMVSQGIMSISEVSSFFTGLAILYSPVSGIGQDMLTIRLLCGLKNKTPIKSESIKVKRVFPKKSIEVKNLSFAYIENNFLFKNLSFVINRGEIVGISGENGKGKTTLAYIIMGILTNFKGEVLVDGQNAHPSFDSLGFSDQDGSVFSFSLKSNIMLGRNIDFPDETSLFLPEKLIKSAKLNPDKLSGGQKKLIAFLRSIATTSSFFIFDEPESSLSESNFSIVKTKLKELSDQGAMILVLTHNKEVLNLCSKIINL